VKKWAIYLKNKFILTGLVFLVYILFLDDVDIFTIINQIRKRNKIDVATTEAEAKLKATRYTLRKLHFTSELESYAREEKMFKKDDEDIFVISYE
jgi:cell division protein DivIC